MVFKFVGCSSDVTEQLMYFFQLMRRKIRLVKNMYLVNVSWLPVGFDRFLLPLVLTSHWPEEFANCTPTAENPLRDSYLGLDLSVC
jgi:hypothetical protein